MAISLNRVINILSCWFCVFLCSLLILDGLLRVCLRDCTALSFGGSGLAVMVVCFVLVDVLYRVYNTSVYGVQSLSVCAFVYAIFCVGNMANF